VPGPVSLLRRTGFRKGVLGTDRRWLALWAGLSALGVLRRFLSRREDVVYRGELQPGESLVVEHLPSR
jgi:hypothetical protein